MKKNFFYVALGLMGIMGTLSIGVVSADCWSDHGATAPDQDSTYASGIVYGCDGNIPIITIYGENANGDPVGITIKAMNEGTGTVIIGTGESSYGSYYQWGNNFPFSDPITLSGYTLVNASENLNASGYYYSGYFVKASGGEWDSSRNYNLRGGSGDSQNYSGAYYGFNTGSFTVINAEGRQAMCPDGYHIPSAGEWNALFYLWDSRGVNTKLGVKLNEKERIYLYSLQNRRQLSDDLYLPIAGYRYYSNPSINENESLAVYWSSSSLDEGSAWPFAIKLSAYIELDYYNYGYKTTAKPIRCFKNSYVEPPTPSTFTLTFTGSGQGSISTGSIEAEAGASITIDNGAGSVSISGTVVATGIANEGYVFSGWLTDCGNTVTASCSFTGEFKPITYSVHFTGTDVSGTMANQNFTYDVTGALTANAFTRTGYTFSGWIYGTTGYTDGQEVSNLTATNNDIITFTAQWTPITYTIDFSGNATNVSGTQAPINAEYDSGDIAPESSFTLTGYTFTGWNTESDGSGTGYVTGDTLKNLTTTGGDVVTLYAQWKANTYIVTFDVNGGNALIPNTGLVTYDAAYGTLPTPSRGGYSFNGWFTAATNGTKITGTTVVSATGDHTLYAQWTQNPVSGGSSSGGGGGGGGSSKAKTSNDSTKSTDSQTGSKVDSSTNISDNEENTQDSSAKASEGQNQGKTYSDEFQNAYEFAYKHGITTMPTIEQANMEGPLTRIAMAKMLSYYAINVLGLKPDTSRKIKFRDVSDKMDAEYNNAVILAYQLGIMGINMPKNRFRPNDLVTRGEFATALSRMLYKIADGKDKYYSTHLAKLMEEKIITNDNPNLQELRGYVMIMLMRSAENKSTEN